MTILADAVLAIAQAHLDAKGLPNRRRKVGGKLWVEPVTVDPREPDETVTVDSIRAQVDHAVEVIKALAPDHDFDPISGCRPIKIRGRRMLAFLVQASEIDPDEAWRGDEGRGS